MATVRSTRTIPTSEADARLADLAQRSKELAAELDDLRAQKARLDGKIMARMEKRGISSIEVEGIKITMVTQRRTVYDLTKAAAALPRSIYKRVTKPAIDPDELAQAVKDGAIDPELLAEFAEVRESAPFVRVSVP